MGAPVVGLTTGGRLATRLDETGHPVLRFDYQGQPRAAVGYSLLLGARAALVGMGAALPDLQMDLLRACAAEDWPRFVGLSALCDRFAQATFVEPMEGYVRRMLWAAAADGALPPDACDDPWGPALPQAERALVEQTVRNARAAGA